jgi:hypothetical protein
VTIGNIPEINKVFGGAEKQVNDNLQVKSTGGKKCIFDPQINCNAPNCKLDICATCPYGHIYALGYSLKNVYRKIVSTAVFLIDRIYSSSNKIEDKLIK